VTLLQSPADGWSYVNVILRLLAMGTMWTLLSIESEVDMYILHHILPLVYDGQGEAIQNQIKKTGCFKRIFIWEYYHTHPQCEGHMIVQITVEDRYVNMWKSCGFQLGNLPEVFKKI